MEKEPKDNLPDYSKDPLLGGLSNMSDERFDGILESLDERKKRSQGKMQMTDENTEKPE